MSAAWFSSVRTPAKRIEGLVTTSQIPAASAASFFCLRSRVEDGRGGLGHAATLRFPSPLIKPDVRISRIQLSDWLHRKAHVGTFRARDKGAARPVPRRRSHEKTALCRAPALCVVCAGNYARDHRHDRQQPDTPMRGRHGRSKPTSRPTGGSVELALQARRPCSPVSAVR